MSLFLAVVGHYLWYSSKFSINYFGYAGYLWFGFWFGFIANLSWSRLRSSFLPSNWLLKISPGRLLIKFRSFQNYFYPETDPVVIDIHWRDIDWVRMTKETSSRTTSDTTETRFYTYLDIKLNLSDVEIKDIKLQSWNYIHDENNRRHYGPMGQDFFRAFGQDELGTFGKETALCGSDVSGINMIAVQALEKRTAEDRLRIGELTEINEKILAENEKLRHELSRLKILIDGLYKRVRH